MTIQATDMFGLFSSNSVFNNTLIQVYKVVHQEIKVAIQ